MSNELTNTYADCLPAMQGTASLQQTGQKIYNIKNVEHAGDIHSETVINIFGSGLPGMPGYQPARQQTLDMSRYHLFVICGEDFSRGSFQISKKRALTESNTCEAFQEKYIRMTDEVIEELKKYPALFMDETNKQKLESGEQYVYWGVVTDIKRMSSDIKIYFVPLTSIPISQIVEIKDELDIMGAPFFGEMNHTHWALKDVNIIEVLSNAGISVMAPTL